MTIAADYEVSEGLAFACLGIGEAEERVYRWLLFNYGATVSEAVQALSLARGEMRRVLRTLEHKGLAAHASGRPRKHFPIPPDIALVPLLSQQEVVLQQLWQTVREIEEAAASAATNR